MLCKEKKWRGEGRRRWLLGENRLRKLQGWRLFTRTAPAPCFSSFLWALLSYARFLFPSIRSPSICCNYGILSDSTLSTVGRSVEELELASFFL